MKKKRILIVVNDLSFFLSHRLQIAVKAQRVGYEVFIVTPGSPNENEIEKAKLMHIAWPLSRGSMDPFRELNSLWALAQIFKKYRPDLVHLVTIKPMLYGGVLARLLRIRSMIAAVSGLGTLFVDLVGKRGAKQRLLEMAYRFAFGHKHCKVIVQNQDDLKTLKFMRALHSNQSVMIKGSGVDLERFNYSPLHTGTPLVILPARMLWNKGVGEFVEAAKILLSNEVNVRMALVGPYDPHNPEAVPLVQLEKWKEEGPVEWWGYREDMPDILAACHFVVLPSYREGIPKALQEAAAAGRAIVTTDAIGCREVVDHGLTGLLVPLRDSSALAEAIESLLSDFNRLEVMGQEGRKKAEEEFNIENVIDAHLEIYKELCPI